MNQSDFDRFSLSLTALAELYGKPLSQGAIALWWQALERFEYEQVSKAIRMHTEDAQAGQFMPKPADLIRALEGTATDRAQIAWGKALDAAQRIGAYSDVVFDDAAIHAVIEDLGGWPKFCRGETAELSYLQHRFTKSYQAYVNRPMLEYPRRLSGDRSPDEMYLKRGLPAPKPAVIGDVVKAREVYRGGLIGGKTAIGLKGFDEAMQQITHAKDVA